MGRVLSPYSNPIQAGVDTFTQLSRSFNDSDRLAREEMDHEETRADNAQRRQLVGLQTEYEAGKVEEQKVAKEHAMLQPYVASALTKLKYSADNGTLPEFTPEEHGAIHKLQKDSPYLSDDPQGLMKQAHAVNGLLQSTPQLLQGLEGHAKTTGQSKFIITDQNAPGVVQNFNEAFGKAFGGDEYHKLFIDVQAGTITPAKEDGTPLTDKEGKPKSIPFDQLKQVAQKMQQFGSLALASHAQLGGDDKRQKEVESAIRDHTVRGKTADALDDFKEWKQKNPDADANEQKMELRTRLVKADVPDKEIEAAVSRVLKDPTSKKSGMAGKVAKGKDGKFYYLDNDGDMTNMEAPAPKDNDADLELRRELARGREEDRKTRLAGQQGKQDEKKEKDKTARRDKLINENLHTLGASPDWKDKEYGEKRAEAERLADLQVEGKSTAPPRDPQKDHDKRIKPLKDTFAKTSDGLIFGTDFKGTIKGALDKGWTPEEIKDAARGTEAETAANEYKYPEKSRAAALAQAGTVKKADSGSKGNKAPVNAIKAAVATATSRADAVAILKRQGYTHDENGKPL